MRRKHGYLLANLHANVMPMRPRLIHWQTNPKTAPKLLIQQAQLDLGCSWDNSCAPKEEFAPIRVQTDAHC